LIAGLGIDEAKKRATAYENAGADAILIHSRKTTPNEVFQFTDSWKGSIPIVVVPTTYPNVNIDELIAHKIKMVIYANQSLRAAHASIVRLFKEIKESKSLSEIKEEMSSMEEIFRLQEMFKVKEEEEDIEKELKKLGYRK